MSRRDDGIDLFDPESAALQKAKEELLEEYDIASELYLVKQFSSLRYSDIMAGLPAGTVTSTQLLSWVNDLSADRKKSGKKIYRPGILTLYKKERPGDFVDGVWQARNLCSYALYLAKKLTDKKFVNGQARAMMFNDSFQNPAWLYKAVALAAIKLLEDRHESGAIKSVVARSYLSLVIDQRDMIDEMGRVVGFAFKHQEPEHITSQKILDNINYHMKNQLRCLIEIHSDHPEYKILAKHEPLIISTMAKIPEKIRDKKLMLPTVETLFPSESLEGNDAWF